jgi:hypothetical protein
MVDFIINANRLSRHSDGCVYGKTRKTYVRNHPYPATTIHVKSLPREKTAIIKMRRLGHYSINQLSEVFGRSRSFIHKTLRHAEQLKIIPKIKRNMVSDCQRKYNLKTMLKKLQNWYQMWEAFILGETDKPP